MAHGSDTHDGNGRATGGRRLAQGEEAPARTAGRRHRLVAVALAFAAAVALGATAIIVFAPGAKGSAPMPIIVTGSSDDSDGNVSSVAALEANPGPDGTISLREAIEVTNATPGQHEIAFARPMTIRVGAGGSGPLPRLSGQADVVGDVNGDGTPDVTLKMAGSAKQVGTGLTLSSSYSSVRDVSIEDFPIGVMFWLEQGRTYTGLAVTGVVVAGAETGIGGILKGDGKLIDTSIDDNSISASYSGIGIGGSRDDQIDAITITGNKVQLSGRYEHCHWSGQGINVSSGFATSHNTIDGVTIAHNSVAGDAALGITVTSGVQGGSSNVVRNVRILQNRVRLGKRVQLGACMPQDIEMAAGDTGGRPARPSDNLLEDVEIRGNSLFNGEGMWIFTGGSRETMQRLRITDNSIHVVGPYPGLVIFGSGLPGIMSSENRVSDIVIDSNKVSVSRARPQMMRPSFGGISIIGGDTMAAGPITGSRFSTLRITNNVVDTIMPSISLAGGFGGGSGEGAANHNAVVDVSISKNRILRRPTRWRGSPDWRLFEPGIRGIRIVGGLRRASGNRVSCVRLSGNRVAGVKNAASVVANALGASRNRADRSC